MLKTIIISIMFVKISVSTLVGSCNQCFASNKIACMNETHFAPCYQGSLTATITKCPNNRFCTDDVLICHSSAEGYTPICYNDNCGECATTNGVFTCVNETTYAYCFNATTPLKEKFRSCPQGYVCNYNSPKVCVRDDVNEPSCHTKEITTEINTMPTEPITDDTILVTTTKSTLIDQTTATNTTIAMSATTTQLQTTSTLETTTKTNTASSTNTVPHDANTICREIGKTGYSKSDDPTCRKYVYCYPLSGQYLGWFYNCQYYFNDATKKCQKEKPVDCVAY